METVPETGENYHTKIASTPNILIYVVVLLLSEIV